MPKECLRRSRDLEITLTPSRVLKWLRVEFKEPHDCSLDHSPCSLFFRKQTQILSCNNNEDKVSSQGSSSELQTGQESKDPLGKDNARNHTARPSGPTRLQQREEAVSSRADDGFRYRSVYRILSIAIPITGMPRGFSPLICWHSFLGGFSIR